MKFLFVASALLIAVVSSSVVRKKGLQDCGNSELLYEIVDLLEAMANKFSLF